MANHKPQPPDPEPEPVDPANEPQVDDTGTPQPVFLTLSQADLITLIREGRRDPKMEAKEAEEDRRRLRRRDQRIRIARQDEASRKARQASCRHRKPNGEETSGGQAFSDGRVRIFCLRCQAVLRAYWSPEVAQGIALQKKIDRLGITEAELAEAMEVEGVGALDPARDAGDDFALGAPRGYAPDLTTENAYHDAPGPPIPERRRGRGADPVRT